MTKKRDLKDLIRARMQKTGESYTAARASFLGPDAKHIAPRSEWAELAGIKDATLLQRTDKSWAQWVDTLDQARAFEWEHPKIAKFLSSQYELGGWWAQSITVGYERIHGIREVGQSPDGSFAANKSKTFHMPVSEIFPFWAQPEQRLKWLDSTNAVVRNLNSNKSLIMDWEDGTQVDVYFVDKGPKTAVQVQHKNLQSKDEIDARKSYWETKLNALKEVALG